MIYLVKNGEYMPVTKDGFIGRTGSHTQGFKVKPSERWRIVGAVMRNNFGAVTRRYTVSEILADPGSIPWKFKNGKQRVFVMDHDHGSVREWRGPHHVSGSL